MEKSVWWKTVLVRALLEFVLELTGGHFFDQVERPRAELDSRATAVVSVVALGAIGSSAHRDNREEDTNGDDGKGSQTLRHHKAPVGLWVRDCFKTDALMNIAGAYGGSVKIP